jgi:hypothetical protein
MYANRFAATVVAALALLVLMSGFLGQTQLALAAPLPTSSTERLYVSPDCLPSGETLVTVQGRGFIPNTLIHVEEYYSTPGTVDVTSDAYGSFTIEMTMAHDGYNYVSADYESSTGTYAYINDCDPTVVATPQCNSEVMSIPMNGSHFGVSGDHIDLTVYDSSGYVVGSNTIAYSDTWSDAVSFDGSLPDGQYKVWAQGYDGNTSVGGGYTYFLIPCPDLSVDPTCAGSGGPPDTMTLTVTAGSPGSPLIFAEPYVEFVFYAGVGSPFDKGADPQEFQADESDAGVYSITPYARPNDTYTLLVKQGYTDGGSGDGGTNRTWIELRTTFLVPCFVPTPTPSPTPTGTPPPTPSPTPTATPLITGTTLTVTPTCAAPQLDNDLPLTILLTLTGSGFQPGPLTLTYDADGSPLTFGASALFDGTFNQLIPVPAGRDGSHRILAHQEVVGAFVPDAQAFFVAPCLPPSPLLTSDFPCGEPAAGLPAAYLINLTGTGFLPGRIEITFDAGGLLPELTVAIADPNGAFIASLTPTGRAPATYAIVAHQHVTGSSLAVDASTSFVVACIAPFFRLMPDNGPRGFVVTVEGQGFPPDADILLRWSRGIDAARPAVAHTDLNGTFSRQLLIFNSDFVGPRELTVELASDPLAFVATLPAPFRVTVGTVSPPFSLAGNPFAAPGATIVIRR